MGVAARCAEGRAEGRLLGQLETARETLVRLLRRRFGDVPEATVPTAHRASGNAALAMTGARRPSSSSISPRVYFVIENENVSEMDLMPDGADGLKVTKAVWILYPIRAWMFGMLMEA